MQTLQATKLKTTVGEDRVLTLTLPDDFPYGEVEVVICVSEAESASMVIKRDITVNETRTAALTLPYDFPMGEVEAIVILKKATPHKRDPEAFKELMNFHKKHRTTGLNAKELITEGRR